MFEKTRFLAISALIFGLSACATAPAPAPLDVTLQRDASLSTFNRLVQEAGLSAELHSAGAMTVFVPSDEAFKALPAKVLAELSQDKAQLKTVLSFHIVNAKLASAEIKDGVQATRQGANLALARTGEFVTVEEALVQRADINASNGVAHVIDRVLMPPKPKK